MRVHYVNLADAEARRRQLEASFQQFAPASLQLRRIEAIGADEVVARGLPGSLRPAEKACFLSHVRALEQSLDDDQDVFVVEDDALFGPSTFRELQRLDSPANDDVEMVFTSAMIGEVAGLLQQYLTYRNLIAHREVRFLDLAQIHFAGADAYLVRARAKAKVVQLLRSHSSLDVPYDLVLRNLIHAGRLRAVLAFPFLTMLSPQADASQLGNCHPTVLAYNCLRRMLALDANHYAALFKPALEELEPGANDEQAEELARIVRVVLSYAP